MVIPAGSANVTVTRPPGVGVLLVVGDGCADVTLDGRAVGSAATWDDGGRAGAAYEVRVGPGSVGIDVTRA